MSSTTEPASTGEKQLINYRRESSVAVIELSDPPANTYSYEVNRQFDDAILAARMDNDVHVIVLTGAGEKFFCAGVNIQMLADVDPTFKYYFCLHANETLLRLENTPKLVIAALNGHCVGGGLEIAMAADLRIGRKRRRQDRAARSEPWCPAGDRRDSAPVADCGQVEGDRVDGDGGDLFV